MKNSVTIKFEQMSQVYDFLNEIRNLQPYKFEKNDIRVREIYTTDIIPKPIYDENYEIIDSIEEKFKDKELERGDRIKLREELMKYTVSIPMYEYERYEREVRKGKASRCNSIVIDRFTKVKVMDCNYDTKGFYAKGYVIQTGDGEFL